uniref:Nudix (nucleoside diphosphate linked moiety X)-type motif 22 n=1 Tax=Sinocyclocheilus rhinocerous TaxID=307959 RepID=A0A673L556_9TELE
MYIYICVYINRLKALLYTYTFLMLQKNVKIFDLLQSHSRFNRQSFPEIEQHIEAVWSDRVAKEPWLFNGAKFRLHSAVLADKSSKDEQSCVLTLQLGLTCYKDYLGTNWSREAGRLQSHGQNECADPQAFLAQPLGVGAVMATADGDVVLLRRSQKVAEAAGLLDIPGGHPEPKVRYTESYSLLPSSCFLSIFLLLQVNVPVSSLSKPVFMGIALNHTSAGRPSAEFYVRCTLTTEDVRDFYRHGGPEAHESTEILFLSRAVSRAPLWSEMCPSAKGAVLLYQRVMPDC